MVSLLDNISSTRGLYLPEEAAFYARIHPTTMKRWMDGGPSGERVFRSEADGGEQKFATFLDFVQAMAIRSIRTSEKVNISLQKIRAAVNYAEEKGVKYPFAREHMTFWDGRDIHIRIDGRDYVQATGKNVDQASLQKIVEVYMLDLKFDSDGLANGFKAFSRNGCDIHMSPDVRFGEPIVSSCGYTAQALWEAYDTEGGIKAAACAYGVQENEVECAIHYRDHLLPKAA